MQNPRQNQDAVQLNHKNKRRQRDLEAQSTNEINFEIKVKT